MLYYIVAYPWVLYCAVLYILVCIRFKIGAVPCFASDINNVCAPALQFVWFSPCVCETAKVEIMYIVCNKIVMTNTRLAQSASVKYSCKQCQLRPSQKDPSVLERARHCILERARHCIFQRTRHCVLERARHWLPMQKQAWHGCAIIVYMYFVLAVLATNTSPSLSSQWSSNCSILLLYKMYKMRNIVLECSRILEFTKILPKKTWLRKNKCWKPCLLFDFRLRLLFNCDEVETCASDGRWWCSY